MTTFEHFSIKKISPVAWKNGGGITREIACSPLNASIADFDWRVSVAEVRSDGAFSIFENVDRTIVLLGGAGMKLMGAQGETIHELTQRFAPFAFAGETPISAQLLNGPSRDFNVMTRRGTHHATVGSLTESCARTLQENGVLLVAQGQWTFRGASFSPGEGCAWRDASVQSAQLVCDVPRGGQALFVSIHRTIVE
jgi:uncharacterized protein